ncbi:MAG: hypothetical protein KVP17_004724 [Porospora cf. gigantea B]|uniref:uncharacterized protein n=1 Tax=Porospora cf. gigantea B TaxID=2853592 RepID=UPI0035719262|nr:MAG: hypothetical protein KVP17_004724 [Porospora cf. gigantea B]
MSRRSFLLAQEHGVLKRNLAEVLRKMRPRANDVDYMREGAIEEALTGHLTIETACFPYVSVIFVGVEDFQNLILTLDPDALVKTLDALFCSLDAVASAQKAFKVETVGETYLAATGLCAKPDIRDCVEWVSGS